MKTNAFLRGVFFGVIGFALVTSAGLSSAQANGPTRQTRIIQLKDSKSGDTLNVEAPVSTRAEFDQDKPSKLFAERERMRQEMIRNCNANKVGIVRSVQKAFVPESVGFAAAIAIVGQLESHGDPAAMKHWWEMSILDPLAHVSFAMFMVGNRAAGQFFSHVGMTFDPCVAVKRSKPGMPLTFSENRLQKTFRPLAGGMAMSVGFIASSITHELLADPNLRMCANIMLGRVPQERMKEAERACDIAHEEWAPGAKMTDYLDDVLANITFVGLQGYGVEAAKQLMSKGASGVEALAKREFIAGTGIAVGGTVKMIGSKMGRSAGVVLKFGVVRGAKTILFRGVTWGLAAGKFVGGPVVRGAIWIGNMVIFLKGIEMILPYFERPLTKFFDGREVTGGINEIMAELNKVEKNGWVWAPPAKPLRCTTPPRGMATLNYEFDDYVPPECFKDPKTPGQLIDRLNYKQKKWREFVLREAYTETSNWQDFALEFTNTYSSAYKMYAHFVSQIQNQRFMVAKGLAEPDYLYMQIPLLGLPIDYTQWNGKVCNLPKETKDILEQARKVIDAELAQPKWKTLPGQLLKPDTWLGMPNLNPNFGWKDWRPFNSVIHHKEPAAFKRNLETIRAGLVAADCRLPMPVTPEYKTVRGMTGEQLENLRKKRFTMAVATLFTVLTREPESGYARYTDAGRDIDHPWYPFLSKINIYMKLNMILQDPEPYPQGVFYVRLLDDEASFVDQDRKEAHPRKVGQIATPKMSEYILANMVCGPEADRRDQVSIQSMPGRAKTLIQRYVARSWGANDNYTSATNERMIDIVKGWKSQFIPPRIIDDPGYDICNTKPSQGDWKMDAGKLPTNDYKWDPHMNFWTVRGQKHRGFLEIVKNHIRRDVLGNDMNDGSFNRWWASKVEPHAKRVVADFQKEYRHIIATKYLPALTKQERATYNGRSFALGARNSMVDEFKLNAAILKRLHNAGRAQNEPGFNGNQKALNAMTTVFERMAKMVGTQAELKATLLDLKAIDAKTNVTWSSPVAVKAYSEHNQALTAAIDAIDKAMKASVSPKLAPAAVKTVNEIRTAAIVNLKNLVTELDSYNGMLLSLRTEDVALAAN